MGHQTGDSIQAGAADPDRIDSVETKDEKKDGSVVDIEATEPQKTYFSKLSVWLMILFSGLAIRSDGYNAAVIGNVQLLMAIIYPEALTSEIRQRLSNAFLVGMIVGILLFGVVAGVGAVGEYPVAGAGAAEATDETRATWAGLVPLLLLLLCVCEAREEQYGVVWRLSFALGTLLPLGIFSSTIISRANAGESLVRTLGWGVVTNCFYIPGPFLGDYISDKIGRRKTMALGSTLQAILGFVLGGASEQIQLIFLLFVVMYGVFLTLGEVGPGITVVITSTECFPTSIRGQMMGLVSAWSKAGAAIGTQVFTAILNNYTNDPQKGNKTAFLIGSAFAVLSALIALFVIPEVSRNLDDDDRARKQYLTDNKWEAGWGDTVSKDPSGVVQNTART